MRRLPDSPQVEATLPVTAMPASVLPQAPYVAPLLDVNMMLHQSRGALLRGMPVGARRLLSAGCAGRWYFDWIEQTYGWVPEHLGIEYYSPEPAGLPANVRWIANTASDMSAVEAESCDLVFSGQNLEHLWPEEVSGFLLEAARVLRSGGHVVIDSPNRLVTAGLNWSHPEHTLELTAEEVATLLALSGFDVTKVRGIWLCRDPRTGEMLPFDPNVDAPGWSMVERLAVASGDPVHAFIWWVEARRADRPPDAFAVQETMARLFATHWPERVQRLLVPAGLPTQVDAEGTWVTCDPGYGGIAMFGPYMALRTGHYRVTWQVRPSETACSPVAVCDVVAGTEVRTLARQEVAPGTEQVSLSFFLAETTFGLQFRCAATGGDGFSVLRKIQLVESPDAGASVT